MTGYFAEQILFSLKSHYKKQFEGNAHEKSKLIIKNAPKPCGKREVLPCRGKKGEGREQHRVKKQTLKRYTMREEFVSDHRLSFCKGEENETSKIFSLLARAC